MAFGSHSRSVMELYQLFHGQAGAQYLVGGSDKAHCEDRPLLTKLFVRYDSYEVLRCRLWLTIAKH